jgi:hypothetical protein
MRMPPYNTGLELCSLHIKTAMIDVWDNEILADYINEHIDSILERIAKVKFRKGATRTVNS